MIPINKREHPQKVKGMIDFIKLSLCGFTSKKLLENPLFKFTHEVCDETGEILCSKTRYKNLRFKIYPSGYCELAGSLHYYFNNGKQNYNDFTYNQLLWVLSDLEQKFQIHEGIIKNLETGVNINPPIPSYTILNGLLFHIGKPFYQPIDRSYKECSHQRLYIKCYDKGKQFDLNEELLRFELKYVKMEDLSYLGIKYLSDLKNKEKLTKLKNIVLRYWGEILFYDPSLNIENFPISRQNKFLQYPNPEFWKNLTSEQRKHHRKVLYNHTKYNSDNLQLELYNEIEKKFTFLLGE